MSEEPNNDKGIINTAGGTHIEGNVQVAEGDFVSRDKIVYGYSAAEVALLLEQTRSSDQPQPPTAANLLDFERKPFEPETVLIPAGPFFMGAQPAADIPAPETPQHPLTLPIYGIGKYPVTNAQYAAFLRHNPQQEAPDKRRWFLREPLPEWLNHPVVTVNWQEAYRYCLWLSQETGRPYRLPSEAEWEKAARGPDGWRYSWGDQWHDGCCNVGNHDTTPVDAFPAGTSPYGCLDMLGNVQEWVRTRWGRDEQHSAYPYPYHADDGREDDTSDGLILRIHRGGSFRSQPTAVRCSARAAMQQTSKVAWRGFRVALALP